MLSPKLKPIVGLALAISLAAGPAGARSASRRGVSEEQELVNHAQSALVHFRNDPRLSGFRENEKDARALLIIPRAVRAGLVFGGSGGPGVLLSRTPGSWNGPAFYSVATASFGIQLGVDVSEVVVLVMTERGLLSLMTPSTRAGMDASIAAGPVGIGAGRPARPDTDFVYYARSKGFYGGVSMESAMIRPDAESNSAYYGRPASAREILVRGTIQSPGSRRLIETVEGTSRTARR